MMPSSHWPPMFNLSKRPKFRIRQVPRAIRPSEAIFVVEERDLWPGGWRKLYWDFSFERALVFLEDLSSKKIAESKVVYEQY